MSAFGLRMLVGALDAAVAGVAGLVGSGAVEIKAPPEYMTTNRYGYRPETIRHTTVRSYDRRARRKGWISARQQRKLAKALRRGTLTAQAVAHAKRQGGAL